MTFNVYVLKDAEQDLKHTQTPTLNSFLKVNHDPRNCESKNQGRKA